MIWVAPCWFGLGMCIQLLYQPKNFNADMKRQAHIHHYSCHSAVAIPLGIYIMVLIYSMILCTQLKYMMKVHAEIMHEALLYET